MAHPLSRRAFEPRTVEAYLRGNSRPRYMERLLEIEIEYQAQLRLLEAAYRALEDSCGHHVDRFSERWRAEARAWSFDQLNELIREHNAWYPVEASLPMDPRTRDYVAVRGASYRRIELGPEWILEHFPSMPGRSAMKASLRAPREPI
jgi:hypothetical protein